MLNKTVDSSPHSITLRSFECMQSTVQAHTPAPLRIRVFAERQPQFALLTLLKYQATLSLRSLRYVARLCSLTSGIPLVQI